MHPTTRRTLESSLRHRQPMTRDLRPRQLPTVTSHAVPTGECQSDPPSLHRDIRCSRPRGWINWSDRAEWLLGRDRPDEAGEFAGAGDDDLLLWFAAAGHPLPALVEALLAAPGAFDHGRVVAALATGELVADLRVSPCVPGRLDQQPPDVAVADLGDRPLPALLAGGVFRRYETDESHELLR